MTGRIDTKTPGLTIDFIGGNCPVQAEGTINGSEFYFRARGTHWTMSIGGSDVILKPAWHRRRSYGDEPFCAGWMTEQEALKFIEDSAADYASGKEA